MKLSWMTAPLAGVIALSVLASPRIAVAGPEDVAACIKASDQGQEQRDKGLLLEARDTFAACTREVCPAQIRASCTDWASGLAPRIPTLVLAGKDDAGHDITEGTVTLDGKKVEGALSGRAFAVNPGPRTLHVERPGSEPVTLPIVVREGEQRRIVTITLKNVGGSATPTDTGVSKQPTSASESGGGGPPIGPLVLGGVGLVGIGVGAVFGLMGVGDYNDLKDGCGKTGTCSDSDISGVRTKLIVSDIAIGAGVVALGAGIVWWILHKPDKASSTGAGWVPTAHGFGYRF